jgi:hypothetical protein
MKPKPDQINRSIGSIVDNVSIVPVQVLVVDSNHDEEIAEPQTPEEASSQAIAVSLTVLR